MGDDGDRWDSLVAQAGVYQRTGNAEKLEAISADLIEADPLHPFGYRMRAEADRQRERYDDARKAIKEAISYAPEDAYLHFRLAVIERLDIEWDDAEEAIDQAIRLDPENADYWVEKAEIVYWASDYDAARLALEHAFDLEPDHADGIHLAARIEEMDDEGGSRAQAIDHYLEALEADPDDGFVHHNLAGAYLDEGKKDLAYEHAVEALRLEPAEKEFRGTLYRVLRHRSWPYRILTAPGRWIVGMWSFFAKIPWWLVVILVLSSVGSPILLFALAVSLLWLFFWWPVVKAYEFFTLGDLRAKTGEVGTAGWLGFHRWPFGIRMALFLGVTACFWYGLYQGMRTPIGAKITVWVVVILVCLALLGGILAIFMEASESRDRKRRQKQLISEGK